MAVSVLVLGCLAVVSLVGAVTVPSRGNKADSGEKKLRNVIITSFGEIPYDPMESGYYQSDIIPVNNFNDEVQQQTMDVALRTGILVEDPNEKKTEEKEEVNDEIIAETSLEDETTSTNAKRQAESNNYKTKKQSENNEDDFLSPRLRVGYRKSDYGPPQDNRFLSRPFRYGYGVSPRGKSHIPYGPYPPSASADDENINTEYYADLGEGWNLKDAEKILKGRNYNILVVIPGSHNYPEPAFRETPPPPYLSSAHHPLFYTFPGFDYSPDFDPHKESSFYLPHVLHGGTRRSVDAQETKSDSKPLDSSTKFPSAVPYFKN